MAPEVYVRKTPQEGMQPNGAIGIDFSDKDMERVVTGREHLSNGVRFIFIDREDVASMLAELAGHVRLDFRLDTETKERKPQLLESVTAALNNGGYFDEDRENELSVRFSSAEIEGIIDDPVVTFASQEVVNETFLKLLPHAELVRGHNEDNDADSISEVLRPLGLLNLDDLNQLKTSVIAKVSFTRQAIVFSALANIEKSLAEKK